MLCRINEGLQQHHSSCHYTQLWLFICYGSSFVWQFLSFPMTKDGPHSGCWRVLLCWKKKRANGRPRLISGSGWISAPSVFVWGRDTGWIRKQCGFWTLLWISGMSEILLSGFPSWLLPKDLQTFLLTFVLSLSYYRWSRFLHVEAAVTHFTSQDAQRNAAFHSSWMHLACLNKLFWNCQWTKRCSGRSYCVLLCEEQDGGRVCVC